MELIRERLFQLQDIGYKKFQCKLMPTVDPEIVIGVCTPELRKLAKSILKGIFLSSKEENQMLMADFLEELPHDYYEENNLHGLLIDGIKDYDVCVKALDQFLPYVDNWATCDMISPLIFKKNKSALEYDIKRWIKSKHIYMVRFGVCMLMKHFLDEDFKENHLAWVSDIHSEEYYINMVRAWYFATALAKQYNAAVAILETAQLDTWTHNKTIQKAIESYRITEEQKKYLRTLKK